MSTLISTKLGGGREGAKRDEELIADKEGKDGGGLGGLLAWGGRGGIKQEACWLFCGPRGCTGNATNELDPHADGPPECALYFELCQ